MERPIQAGLQIPMATDIISTKKGSCRPAGLGKKRYYLDEDGIMQTGTITIDGQKYTFASDGSLKK